ncbi:MAG: nucleotidyltransferase family protein [Chloroflexi bacterium]|nr:nucleotidyltransferase family protein [Chloroflexota bacterium]
MTVEQVCHILTGKLDPVELDQVEAVARAAIRQGVGSFVFQMTHLPALQVHALRQTAKYALQRRAAKDIQQALDNAQLPAIWLKGIALAETIYPFAQGREMLDLDLYVRREDIDKILQIVEQLGYTPYRSENKLFQENDLANIHHTTLVDDKHVMLEVHWRLLKLIGFIPNEHWFWQQTMSFEIDGILFKTFTPEAHLLYLCAHGLLHHTASELLIRHYLDVHYLASTSALNWTTIIEQAAILNWIHPVKHMLLKSQAYLETPIPASVFTQLQQYDSEDEAVHYPAAIKVEKLRAELKPRDWLRRLQIIWRIMFPPRAYMRKRYAPKYNQPLVSLYLSRLIAQMRTVLQAIVQRRRR